MSAPKKPRRAPRPRSKTRAELLQREQEVWDELTATWAGLPDEALERPGACGPAWSVKDVMNHVAAWQEAALRLIPELLAGRPATLGHGTDRFNALQHAADRDRSLASTRRRLARARRELLRLLERVPDEPLLDPAGRVNWWVRYTTYSHYGEHIWELGEWKRRMKDEG